MQTIDKNQLYTENIEMFQNKSIKEALLVIYCGLVFLIQKDNLLYYQPFHLLDDVSKVLYSDMHNTMMALKLRDMRKFDGRDHLVIIVQ